MNIPLRKVRLPSADAIYPYLKRIDENRWYSNRGQLLLEFEERIAATLRVTEKGVSIVNNATAGLALALLAADIKPNLPCIMPPLTFAASPVAARSAGLEPVFADVDHESLMLTPQSIEYALGELGGPDAVGAVMPVSLYGAPLDLDAWIAFRDRTGIPVGVDAAWSFDSLRPTVLPSVVSLHATKAFGVGEGGIIVSTDADFVARTVRKANFALNPERESQGTGFNGKMSEYSAAVGLAALDDWPISRSATIKMANVYREQLAQVSGVELANGVDGTWAPATILVRFSNPVARNVSDHLASAGIEGRHWWGSLCSDHPANSASRCFDLKNSQEAMAHILNLPFSSDMEPSSIREIVTQIKNVLHSV